MKFGITYRNIILYDGDFLRNIVFILVCLLSRMVSAVYYIEDPDSLRFALSVYDQFDLENMQPAFPGYAVFCFVAKCLYFLLGNLSIAFSIIGGFSVYILIIAVQKILKLPSLSLEGILVAVFIFFNPLIWLLSNRYVPDLAGVAVMTASFAYLVPDYYRDNDVMKGWFLLGILAGLKLSYLPFMLIPALYAFVTKKHYAGSILALCLGVSLWLVPMIIDTGWDNLLSIAQKQTAGYFYEWGNTIFIDNNYALRAESFIQNIWADGLGGFWVERNPAFIFHSIGIVLCIFFGYLIIMNFGYPRAKVWVLAGSVISYSIWAFLFTDIVHKSWNILPLIPFLLIVISYGVIYFLVNYNFIYIKVIALCFLLGNVIIGVVMAVQHIEPTAIAKAKEHITNSKIILKETTVVSTPEINDFLAAQKVNAKFISVHQDSLDYFKGKISRINSGKLILIGNFPTVTHHKPFNIAHFKHNPYVNRIWSDIHLYEYYLSDN